jgi:hypothetical protein
MRVLLRSSTFIEQGNDMKPATNTRKHSRGTAEIETLLAILFLLVPVATITVAAYAIGNRRNLNVFQAGEQSFENASSDKGANPESGGLDPLTGFASVRSDTLPNRMHVVRPQANFSVTILTGANGSPTAGIPVKFQDSAAFMDPAWAYSLWPQASDQGEIKDWFTDYAGEARGQYSGALDLTPSWAP